MNRLCERPGCSEAAALAYGMRTEQRVFWIDALGKAPPAESGVLCQRHGDSMTVPRGWTLDDLRDPDLHLFRPPPRSDGPVTRRDRPRHRSDDDTGQLALRGLADISDDISDDVDIPVDVVDAEHVDAEHVDDAERFAGLAADRRDDAEMPDTAEVAMPSEAVNWKPAFDDGDDLDGQLAARSPLLSRAFRGERD